MFEAPVAAVRSYFCAKQLVIFVQNLQGIKTISEPNRPRPDALRGAVTVSPNQAGGPARPRFGIWARLPFRMRGKTGLGRPQALPDNALAGEDA